MEIAPRGDAAKWQVLKLDDTAGPDSTEAIEILATRIHERFIDPIDYLIAAEDAKPVTERRFSFTAWPWTACCSKRSVLSSKASRTRTRNQSGRFPTSRPKGRGFRRTSHRLWPSGSTRNSGAACCIRPRLGETARCGRSAPSFRTTARGLSSTGTSFMTFAKPSSRAIWQRGLRGPENDGLRRNFRRRMNFISRA